MAHDHFYGICENKCLVEITAENIPGVDVLFSDVTQLGLKYPCTTVDIIKAMPTNSEVKIAINSRSGSITDLPADYCLLTVRYDHLHRYQIFCTRMPGAGLLGTYIGNYVRNTSISWEKILTDSTVLPIANGGTGATTASKAVSNFKTALVDLLYPVGSIHLSVNSANPSTYFGGTWVSWGAGRVPVGVNTSDSDFSKVEKTGGEKTHTLTHLELPPQAMVDAEIDRYLDWADNVTELGRYANSGGGQAHNNLQPYITCYMWKRTA